MEQAEYHSTSDDGFQVELETGSDADSAYGSSIEDDMVSLTSSIAEYVYENGRRYTNRQADYYLPNDEIEEARLDLAHHLWSLLFDGQLFLSPRPPREGGRVLDVGTGTGLWAISYGETYPDATVIGTDLSPMQTHYLPSNVTFEVEDLEHEEWDLGGSFSFIHVRNMLGSIRDWKDFLRKTYDNLEPDGLFEAHEGELTELYSTDGTSCNTGFERITDHLRNAMAALPWKFMIPPEEMCTLLKEAGFIDVTWKRKYVPIGPWAKGKKQKELGNCMRLTCQTGFEAYSLALLTRVLNLSYEEAGRLLDDAKKDLGNRNIHAIYPCYAVWARKPNNANGAKGERS